MVCLNGYVNTNVVDALEPRVTRPLSAVALTLHDKRPCRKEIFQPAASSVSRVVENANIFVWFLHINSTQQESTQCTLLISIFTSLPVWWFRHYCHRRYNHHYYHLHLDIRRWMYFSLNGRWCRGEGDIPFFGVKQGNMTIMRAVRYASLNKRLSKSLSGRSLETPWPSCDVTVIWKSFCPAN